MKALVQMEPAIQKAESKLEHLSSDEETMSIYYAREKSLHDRANLINSAEQRGRGECREEAKKEAARVLLDLLDDETIASRIGLSLEIVKALRND